MTTAPNKNRDQSTSNLATALRARETLANKDKWCTGYRHRDGRMCLVGHILQALGAQTRAEHYKDSKEPNFVYDEEKLGQLEQIVESLGFATAHCAENFNDSNGNHQQILNRFDQGLVHWKDA